MEGKNENRIRTVKIRRMMTNKQWLSHFRHGISREKLRRGEEFFFDKKYYNWMRKEGYERHHTVGRECSDYFLVHLKSEPHNKIRDVKPPFNADVFVNTLLTAWYNLIRYCAKKKIIRSTVKYFKQDCFELQNWIKLIEKIKEVK